MPLAPQLLLNLQLRKENAKVMTIKCWRSPDIGMAETAIGNIESVSLRDEPDNVQSTYAEETSSVQLRDPSKETQTYTSL